MWVVPEAFFLQNWQELFPLTYLGWIKAQTMVFATELLTVARSAAQRGAYGGSRCEADGGGRQESRRKGGDCGRQCLLDPPPMMIASSTPSRDSSFSPCIDRS